IAAPAFLQFAATGIYPKPGPGEPPFQHIALATPRSNPRGVYAYQWSAQAEYRLTNDLAISLGYLGVRGLNLSSATALNVAPAAQRLPTGENDYAIAPGVPAPRLFNPRLAPLSLFFDQIGQSNYQAGTVTLTKRFSRNYSLNANYTWSKSIDNSGSL